MTAANRHSKQGAVRPHTIIDGPADWTSESLKGREDEYTYTFTPSDVSELIRAVDKLKARGVASEDDVKQACHVWHKDLASLFSGYCVSVRTARTFTATNLLLTLRLHRPARSVAGRNSLLHLAAVMEIAVSDCLSGHKEQLLGAGTAVPCPLGNARTHARTQYGASISLLRHIFRLIGPTLGPVGVVCACVGCVWACLRVSGGDM